MKKIKQLIFSLLLTFLLIGCVNNSTQTNEIQFYFTNEDNIAIEVGNSLQLNFNEEFNDKYSMEDVSFTLNNDCVNINKDGLVTAIKPGNVTITAGCDSLYDDITIIVIEPSIIDIELSSDSDEIFVGDTLILKCEVNPERYQEDVEYVITSGRENIIINNNVIEALQPGITTITAKVSKFISNELTITIKTKEILTDPYIDVDINEFYNNYVPAISYMDAYYRTLHGLMSGSIEPQDDEPTIAVEQPMQNGKYLKNTSSLYSDDGNTYYILDCYGNVTNQIYKGGAYISLEEVAAYVLAFNDIPANYTISKKTKPTSSVWGEYLRVNHSKFSGDTSRYPYEPELPNISGCGGYYQYYELDLGTTGTDTGGGYEVAVYNDGKTITRGAARIVYSRFDLNGNDIIDINEKYVFYTYNHYNDFQEYLNYEGGWGEMFGNITGGGTLSSKTNYNPTPYIEVSLTDFSKTNLINLIIDINQTMNNLIVFDIYKYN